ncbi:MAG: carbohydrate kinase, partial [Cyclobacteriaceae bacterium]|nr:carbohydrate kinase [Cyclobacteriaceae bacterium]
RYGVLLCVNGTGILNNWLQKTIVDDASYEEMNEMAMRAPIGGDGLSFIPFGNGAERIMENNDIGARLCGLNFNRHNQSHILRAGQEGIVFALNYGFNIMKEMGMELNTIRAGYANMFLSPLFREAFTNITSVNVELYNTDGAQGAARGAGVGAGIYANYEEAFRGLKAIETIEPSPPLLGAYEDAYEKWLENLT